MPQYAFYTVPRNAKSMNFAELLEDCFSQLRRFESHPYYDLGPLLRAESDIRVEPEVSANIPEPIFLADAMKFFLGPSHLTALVYPVSVQCIDDLAVGELEYEIQNSLELVGGGGLTHAVSELSELPKTAHIFGSDTISPIFRSGSVQDDNTHEGRGIQASRTIATFTILCQFWGKCQKSWSA
jgi:hypothetical protein